MFNNTGNTNQTVTKFATAVDVYNVSTYTKFGENLTIFKKLFKKNRWTHVRGPEHGCRQSLYLRSVWLAYTKLI